MVADISSVRYEDVAFIDETVINGKTYTRLHVPVYDDSRYERANTAALIDNINHSSTVSPKLRQSHFITNDCYEETVGELNGVVVVVCFYFIPTSAILNEDLVSYHFPRGNLDVSTDEIPPEYLTKERVKAMLDLMQERAKLLEDSAVTIEKVSDSNVIYIDERDEAYARLKSGEYNDLVRKPLNPASREYKDGKRYIAVLFRYYLHELIKDGLKACNKEIRDKIPNNTPHKGRKGIPPADYLFYMIDQVHTGKADLEYEGMMPDIVRSGYVSAQWTTTAISMYASKPDLIPFLRFLVTYSAVAFRHREHIFAVDSTGFRCTTRGDYYGDKHHKKKENDWVDAHALVGVNSNVAIAVKAAHKYKEDELVALEDLVLDTLRYYSIEYILGDGGYMSEDKLNFYAEKYNIRLVFPIKSNTVINSEKSTALWNDNNRLNLSDIWNSIYHPRSNVESTFSSIKKSIGEIVWAKNETARLVEVYCKFLAYNIRLLIMYYFVAGIVPEWINENRVKELISAHS